MFKSECLVFDTAMLERGLSNYGEPVGKEQGLEYKNFIPRTDTQLCALIDDLLLTVSEASPFYEMETVGLLYRLFALLYRKEYIVRTNASSESKGLGTVISLLQWIEAHCAEKITLEKISELTHLSPKYVCRIFKEFTSKTVMEYVNECRIERSCSELRHSEITEVAFNSGFNDLSYFCKTFKKYKGITPSEYKKRTTKGGSGK